MPEKDTYRLFEIHSSRIQYVMYIRKPIDMTRCPGAWNVSDAHHFSILPQRSVIVAVLSSRIQSSFLVYEFTSLHVRSPSVDGYTQRGRTGMHML